MKKIVIRLLITSALAAFAFICFQAMTEHRQEPQLSSPQNEASQDTRGLAELISVANEHNDDTALFYHIRIQRVDLDAFRAHLENIAKNKGWYPHGPRETDSINSFKQRLVVPEEDLKVLSRIEEDPIRWVQDRQTDRPADTTSTNLVNVTVAIRAPVSISPWATAGGILSAIATALLLASTIVSVLSLLEKKRELAKAADAQANAQWSPK